MGRASMDGVQTCSASCMYDCILPASWNCGATRATQQFTKKRWQHCVKGTVPSDRLFLLEVGFTVDQSRTMRNLLARVFRRRHQRCRHLFVHLMHEFDLLRKAAQPRELCTLCNCTHKCLCLNVSQCDNKTWLHELGATA